MCSCHSILECCVTFSGVKLSIRSFVLLLWFFWGTLMIYGETVKVAKFSQSTDLITEWVI